MTSAFILRAYLFDGSLIHEQRFTALPIRIGRNTLNDFLINQVLVSNFHASVEPVAGKLCVRDVGSKNGVLVRLSDTSPSKRLGPHEAVDIGVYGNRFFIGPQVQVSVQTADLGEPVLREGALSDGVVLGNAQMLMGPGYDGATPNRVQTPPPLAGQRPTALPPPGISGSPPPFAAPPPVGGPLGDGSRTPAGQPAPRSQSLSMGYGPNGPATGHFGGMALETLALQGLHELAGSLVPHKSLHTSGDLARFITKLHDAVQVFCRCFIPLREGYAQFVSSLDLQRAANVRSTNRSAGYIGVEAARDPESLSRALLDWTERSHDAHKAVEGIYADLMIHQLALLDGVLQGVRALLDELAPENFEQNERQGKFGLSNRYKELWQMYCEKYDELAEEKQAFSRIFGYEFTEAYREYRQRKKSGETS